MHSDEVAQQYGFSGALVAGVVVFGHITTLPASALGEQFFAGTQANVRFLKPAYDGDRLSLTSTRRGDANHVECHNATGVLLATMAVTEHDGALPPAPIDGARPEGPREDICDANVMTGLAAPAFVVTPDLDTHLGLAEKLGDTSALYFESPTPVVHPLWVLQECNSAFMRTWQMPAWIHVGSEICWLTPIHVGDEVTINMVPVARWDNKGHAFTTLAITFEVGGKTAVDVRHTAIYRIAGS